MGRRDPYEPPPEPRRAGVALIPRALRAAARAAWVAGWAALLIGLAAELALQVDRRGAERDAARLAERNVFDVGRAVAEASGRSLWEIPGERYRPGARLELEVAGERYAIEINRHGFRDRDVSLERPPGVFRVVCVGGSTTVQGRTNETTYPALLQRRLDPLPDGRRVEVLNLGVNGTGSGFWLTRADELYAFQPDLVIQYAFVNDFFWGVLPRYAERHPWRAELGRSLLLARLLPLLPQRLERELGRTLIHFREMAEAARQRGVAYLVGSFAGPEPARASPPFRRYLDVNTESWGTPLRLRYYRDYHRALVHFQQMLDDFSRRRGVRVARIHEVLTDPALYVDLCHMTPEGIARLANALAPEVLRVASGTQGTDGGSP